jgi:hypothetical protein
MAMHVHVHVHVRVHVRVRVRVRVSVHVHVRVRVHVPMQVNSLPASCQKHPLFDEPWVMGIWVLASIRGKTP